MCMQRHQYNCMHHKHTRYIYMIFSVYSFIFLYIGWTREGVSGWGTLVWLRTFMLAATSDRTTEPMWSCPTNGWPWRVSMMLSSQRKLMWWVSAWYLKITLSPKLCYSIRNIVVLLLLVHVPSGHMVWLCGRSSMEDGPPTLLWTRSPSSSCLGRGRDSGDLSTQPVPPRCECIYTLCMIQY